MESKINPHVSYSKKEVMEIPLYRTGLCEKMVLGLKKSNIHTIEDLTKLSKNELLQKPGIGDSTLFCCLKILRIFNLKFRV